MDNNTAFAPSTWLWGKEESLSQPLGNFYACASLAFWLCVIFPVHLLVRTIRPVAPPYVQRYFHKKLCQSLGLSVTQTGTKMDGRGILYVANHLSWADIPVLGSHILGSFVAKADLAQWGFWGWMAKQQDTIYVVRENRRESSSQIREIAKRLEEGRNVILFPEGTTSCGTQVLPFKSTLFAVIQHIKADWIDIQPVTLAYTRINGLAVTRAKLPALAWYGDEVLGCHVLNFMRLGKVDAHLYFHEPLRVTPGACRKEVAQKCWGVISSAYSKILNI